MATDKKRIMEAIVKLADKVDARIESEIIIIKGPRGEVKRNIANPKLKFHIKDKSIIISADRFSQKEKKLVYAYAAHLKNMVEGVTEGHKYVLKICASHFPMNVSVSGNQFIVKNFLGEKYPRTLQLSQGVNVKVDGDKINVESADIELAGTTASDIEKLTKRAGFDPRIFQDGIYIISKDGKDIK